MDLTALRDKFSKIKKEKEEEEMAILAEYNEFMELKKQIKHSDELALKFTDGELPESEYEDFKSERKALQERYQELKAKFHFGV